MTIVPRTTALLALSLLAIGGCEEKKSETKSDADAAAQQGPALDPDLAEAVQAAGKKGAQPGAGPGEGKGPPPTGIFGPGEANAELAKGAAAKITLGSDGSAPRVTLSSAPPGPGWKRNGTVEFTIRGGRGQLPAVNVQLALEAAKPAAKPAEGKPAEAEPPKTDGTAVAAKVVKASLAPGQLSTAAAELEKVVAKMKGSRVSFRVLPTGASDGFEVALAKDAAKDIDALLKPVSEALAAVTMPYPDKPVGKGAYWMITSRETVMGIDVVTYRMVRVEDVQNDSATLNLSIKRYAATADISFPGVPPESKLEQFQSIAEGQVTINASAPLLPTAGSLKQNLVAMLTAPAGADPGQKLTAQTASEATLQFPLTAAPKAAAKPPAP